MPVDLALSTNTPTATIELRQAQRLGDNGDHAAFLVVRSGAFAAALPFMFTRDDLLAFDQAIAALREKRIGIARLPATSENDVIEFVAADGGDLCVRGNLHEVDGQQSLTFSFAAAWEGLTTFADGLRRLRIGSAS